MQRLVEEKELEKGTRQRWRRAEGTKRSKEGKEEERNKERERKTEGRGGEGERKAVKRKEGNRVRKDNVPPNPVI